MGIIKFYQAESEPNFSCNDVVRSEFKANHNDSEDIYFVKEGVKQKMLNQFKFHAFIQSKITFFWDQFEISLIKISIEP